MNGDLHCPHCGYRLALGANDDFDKAVAQLRAQVQRLGGSVGADDTVDATLAADLLGRAPSTLNWWRVQQSGPEFISRGRGKPVRYALIKLAEFIVAERGR